MERVVKAIPRDCEIMAMGDTHEDVMLYEEGLQEHIDYIAAEPHNRFWFHVGDWIEGVATDDKRYQWIQESCPIPKKQAMTISDRFKPIAEQGIVGLKGNHERKHHRILDIAEYICVERLGIKYGTGSCRIIFTDMDGIHLFNFLIMHGAWNFTSNAKDYEQQQANMKAMLRMRLNSMRLADCVAQFCGHSHKLMVSPPANPLYLNDQAGGVKQHYLETDCTSAYIPPEQRWCVNTGSYRKNLVDGIDDYAETYGPVELGAAKVIVKNGKIDNIVLMKV